MAKFDEESFLEVFEDVVFFESGKGILLKESQNFVFAFAEHFFLKLMSVKKERGGGLERGVNLRGGAWGTRQRRAK